MDRDWSETYYEGDEEFVSCVTLSGNDSKRVIGVIDMDGYELQVYLKHKYGPELGRNIYLNEVVILSHPNSGRIISVNYRAKNEMKISRKADDVKSALFKCPGLRNEKKDMDNINRPESKLVREASFKIIDCIELYRRRHRLDITVEYSPSDEFYLDLTKEVKKRFEANPPKFLTLQQLGPNCHLEGTRKYKGKAVAFRSRRIYAKNPERYLYEYKLVYGAVLMERIRMAIWTKVKLEASGGVSANKLLAKLACSLHKPGGNTILAPTGIERKSRTIGVKSIQGFGGKLGDLILDVFGNDMTMYDLAAKSEKELAKKMHIDPETASRIRRLSTGNCDEDVTEKLRSNTVAVSKTNLRNLTFGSLSRLLDTLLEDLLERLEEEEKRHCRVGNRIKFEFHYQRYNNRNYAGRPNLQSMDFQDSRGPLIIFGMDMREIIVGEIMEKVEQQNVIVDRICKVQIIVQSFTDI